MRRATSLAERDDAKSVETKQTMFRCLLSRPRWPTTARSISTPVKSLILVPRSVVEVCICACACLRSNASLISLVCVSLAQRHGLVRSITTRIKHSRTNDRTNSLFVTGEKRVFVCVGRGRSSAHERQICFFFVFRVTRALSAFGRAAMCFGRALFVVGWSLRCRWARCVDVLTKKKRFVSNADFTGRDWRPFATATRVVENKLEKAGPELAEAKSKLDKAEREREEAMSELKMAKSELKKLTEKRERGELVDEAAFARADKAVENARADVENARADVQRAHEIYTKLLPGANGACFVRGLCPDFAFFDTLHF